MEDTLPFKRNLVCKEWQASTIKFLYEDIRIRHGARSLVEVLERSTKDMGSAGYGLVSVVSNCLRLLKWMTMV